MEKLTHNIVIQIIKRETVTKGLAFLADKSKRQLGERGHGHWTTYFFNEKLLI